MLTTPDENDPQQRKPLFTAKEVVKFYLNESPHVFPPELGGASTNRAATTLDEERNLNISIITTLFQLFRLLVEKLGLSTLLSNYLARFEKAFLHPKYDGKYLQDKITSMMGMKRLRDTLTNVVIPAYDVLFFQPFVFSTRQAHLQDSRNFKLSDVCISTTAAPTYLPPHSFTQDYKNFNMVDGGLAANNPTLLAIRDAVMDDCKKHIAVNSKGNVDFSKTANDEMVDVYMSLIIRALGITPIKNYLRIQYDGLDSKEMSFDNSDPKHLLHLAELGIKLLNKNVTIMNMDTGNYETTANQPITNAEALRRLAARLSTERKSRQGKGVINLSIQANIQ